MSVDDILRLADRLRLEAVTGTEHALAYRLAARCQALPARAATIDWGLFRPEEADDLRLVEIEARCMTQAVARPSFTDADRAAVNAFVSEWVPGVRSRLGQPQALARFADSAIDRASSNRVIAAIGPPRIGATLARHDELRARWPVGPR